MKKAEIFSLQNNPLLLAKAVEDTPPLTLVQNRILLYIFAKVLDRSKAMGWDFTKMTDDQITVSMLHFEVPWDLGWEVRVGKGGNQTAEIWNQLETLHRTAVKLKGSERRTYLIQAIEPPKVASGFYRVQLDHVILRNIHFQEGVIYRLINLRYALALTSVNHFNLYKILKAVENMDSWKVALDELKEMLHLHGQYPQFSHFRDKVLIPSQQALKEETDISFTFDEVRGIRKVVTHLTFQVKKVQKKPPEPTKTDTKAPSYPPELVADLKARGVQHITRWAKEGITEKHWREALAHEGEPSHLITEAKKLRDMGQAETTKAEKKQKDGDRLKANRKWFEAQPDRGKWDDLGSYIMRDQRVLKFISESFKEDFARLGTP